MIDVRSNYFRILDRIHHAAARSGRDPAAIRLIGVTKTVSPDIIRQAAEAGISHVGENRLQEALQKKQALAELPLTWHFIGHLQTNKAKKAAAHFDWIQSVDRVELAAKLDETASKQLPILVEVKLHEEPNKSGVDEKMLPDLVEHIRENGRLELRGLMAIPPFFDAAEDSRPYFRRLRKLAEEFGLSELSMGMSHDFEVAIEEGASMVRIGTALFGERR